MDGDAGWAEWSVCGLYIAAFGVPAQGHCSQDGESMPGRGWPGGCGGARRACRARIQQERVAMADDKGERDDLVNEQAEDNLERSRQRAEAAETRATAARGRATAADVESGHTHDRVGA